MDPRARRSRDRLIAAVLAFADAGRLDDVSVSELAREADVTRDTFYRHASSVTDLLTIAIAEKLQQFGESNASAASEHTDLAAAFRASEPALLRHIAAHANIYRTALDGDNAAPVARVLHAFLAEHLAIALRDYPGISPLPADEMDEGALAMIAAYCAAGYVGAAREWLVSGDVDDIERAVAIISAGAPEWWRRATGRL